MAELSKADYVVINDEAQSEQRRKILIVPAQAISFPLSDEDMASICELEKAFDAEERVAGLAAPQIGISKRLIIFQAPKELKRWRTDLTQEMPKTIWLNPEYVAIGSEQHEDYEACFSVADSAGMVPRYKKIKYAAYLPNGTRVFGIAEGYLARVMQHEIDHINGILFIHKIGKQNLLSMEIYRRLRNQKMNE